MDFGVVGLVDTNFSHKRYGSGYTTTTSTTTVNEDDLREYKLAKIATTCAEAMVVTKQRSSEDSHHQMLSFSSPINTLALPYYQHMSAAVSKSTGYGSAGYGSAATVHGVLGFRGPFTASQWMELEHQALIYKYIDANVPIPSYLLSPIRKALESAGFSGFPGLRPSALWGSFHLGYSNTDPEPGRCRRTDGKKWRCSRDAVADQKYCERHMNRGRHRSRKPVEGQSGHPASAFTPTSIKPNALATSKLASVVPAGGDANNLGLSHHQLNNFHVSGLPNVNRNKECSDGGYRQTTVLSMNSPNISLNGNAYTISKENAYEQDSSRPEFGVVCSDALLNPLNRSSSFVNARNYGTTENLNDNRNEPHHPLRQFMDEWPKSQSESPVISWPDIDTRQDRTQLSISIPMVTSDFMSSTSSPTNAKLPASPLRLSRECEATKMGLGVGPMFSDQRQRHISWEPSMGGPLGEVLHPTNNECKRTKALNLVGNWDNSPRLAVSSPTGVLQRCAFGSVSNSSAGSSPRAESSKTPLDGASLCNGVIGTGLMHPSLPAL